MKLFFIFLLFINVALATENKTDISNRIKELASQADGEKICLNCPNGTEDIAVTFASEPFLPQDQGWELKLQNSSWHFWKRPHNVKDEGIIKVKSSQEIREKIISLSHQCKRVKFMGIFTHGKEGMLGFKEDNLNRKSIENVFGGLDCAFSSNATISMNGCFVANQCIGQYFVSKLAKTLLKKGGVLNAPTSYSQQYPLVPSFTFNLAPEKIIVNTKGELISSKNSYHIKECLSSYAKKLNDIAGDMKFCGYSKEENTYQLIINSILEERNHLNHKQDFLVLNADELDSKKEEKFISTLEMAEEKIEDSAGMFKFYLKCIRKNLFPINNQCTIN
jgi:hypothetical protein